MAPGIEALRLHLRLAAWALCLGGMGMSAQAACDAPARELRLPRAAAAYGTLQHAPLPLEPGEVVLSFDDGPRPGSTPEVLKVLAAHCAPAVFFMNGEPLREHPAIARAVRDAGHSIGMHGFRHDNFSQLPEAAQLADLQAMQQAYREVLGSEAAAYRFPFLAESAPLRQALQAQRITLMSVDAGAEDWLPAQTPRMLTDKLMSQLRPKGRGILLLHDAQDQTAQALPLILDTLRDAGYRLVRLRWD